LPKFQPDTNNVKSRNLADSDSDTSLSDLLNELSESEKEEVPKKSILSSKKSTSIPMGVARSNSAGCKGFLFFYFFLFAK